LIQSHTGNVSLLPALPAEWTDGQVSGLLARGGFEISMIWEQHRLTEVEVKSRLGNPLILKQGDNQVELETTTPNTTYRFDGSLTPLN